MRTIPSGFDYSDGPPAHDFPACFQDEDPAAPIPAVSERGVILMTLLQGASLAIAFRQRRIPDG